MANIKSIKKLITQIGSILSELKLSLVSAESCTGGGLAYYICQDPKCSFLLERGYVTYSDQAKEQLLNVIPTTLQTHGPVSEETALEMAQGALKNSCAQISIAITGLAGPDRGDDEKKGTVWIACSGILYKTQIRCKEIAGSRQEFCNRCIEMALKDLHDFLQENYVNK